MDTNILDLVLICEISFTPTLLHPMVNTIFLFTLQLISFVEEDPLKGKNIDKKKKILVMQTII